MIQVKEINKNRKAKFERLLVEYVNNRIDANAVLGRSFIYKNLLGLAGQYLVFVKQEVMSCKSREELAERLSVHVSFLLDFNKNFDHISKCINSIKKGRFSPEVEQKKESYFGRKMEVEITELGYIVNFPEERVKLFCTKKIINDIKFNL